MKNILAIRREDKNIWERRVPLIPEHIKEIIEKNDIKVIVQPFPKRAFSDDEYLESGAELNEDLSKSKIIFGVKEIPIDLIEKNKVYIFFSHTIKGQDYNMPLLKKNIDSNSTLIDYECIMDENGKRLVFFGKYAGLAGMIDGIHAMGRRYKANGFDTPFQNIKQAYEYTDLDEAKSEIQKVSEQIKTDGLPKEICPFVVGFSGYGNVSKGAQEVFDLLPHKEISPEELLSLSDADDKVIYKVVFKEKDMFERIDGNKFELQDYFDNPEKYKSRFENYLDKLSVLVNAIYWHDKCPRLVTKEYVKNRTSEKLQLIVDITCDINGSIEFTEKATMPDNPTYVYNPDEDRIIDGYEGKGIADLAIDNLPAELPKNSSREFSNSLKSFVPGIEKADYNTSLEQSNLPDEIKRAVIVYNGRLTDNFKYLEKFINE